MAVWWEFAAICKDCLLFGGSSLFLIYGLLVLGASLAQFDLVVRPKIRKSDETAAMSPPLIGELGELSEPRPSAGALVLLAVLRISNFEFFQSLVGKVLEFIRTVFLMRDSPPFRTSFIRYLIFYFLTIPLPAAFMPPIAHAQRKPDFQLLSAVVLLIMINALGDAISVRV